MRVFIGCSASNGINPKYHVLASSVSEILAKHDNKLVFGGYDEGMMGKCYMTFKYHDKKVKGIADIRDIDELKRLELNASEVTNTTFERTMKLFNSSELIVILPGGIGTFAEIFAMLDEMRTREDFKPFIIFNYEGYYDDIIELMNKAHKEYFVSDNDIKLFDVVTSLEEFEKLIERLEGDR